MHTKENIVASFQSILSHKLRSALTLLGIIIGVFAVITMYSAVDGMKKMVMDNMESMGWNNSLMVFSSEDNGSTSTKSSQRFWRFMYMRRSTQPLTFDDYTDLNNIVKSKYAYGMIERWQRVLKGEELDWTQVRAVNNDYFISKTYPIKKGRYFNRLEDMEALKVCIVGPGFVQEYDPDLKLGDTVKMGEIRYRVIGILAQDQLNQMSGMNFNNWERRRDLRAFYIPLSTAARYLSNDGSLDYIYFQAYGDHDFSLMKTAVRQNLLKLHNMSHDFQFNDVGAVMFKISGEIKDIMKKLNITLSTIASISLIVGGIGLFSTLLISISERMKEIGIRKSIGATDHDIFFLFISESIILAMIAAFIGALLSSLVIMMISNALHQNFIIPVQGVLIGFGFSLLIGILSGAYPAVRASKIDPITAIYFND